MGDNIRIYELIREHCDRLSVSVITTMFDRNEEMRRKYKRLYERLVSDVQFHYSFLGEAVRNSSTELFSEYLNWLTVFFQDINVPATEISLTFKLMQEVLEEQLEEEDNELIAEYFQIAYQSLEKVEKSIVPSFVETDNPYRDLAREFFTLISSHKRFEAMNLINEVIEQGIPIQDIYLYVFQKSLQEVGRLWQTNKMSVAQEHTFTASTQLIMSQLYDRIFSSKREGGKVIAACVGRELHEIGIRMVADFFEMEGWDTLYIGANTPTATMIDIVQKEKPDILALSVTLLPHLKQLREIITKIKERNDMGYVKVIVGGYPFNIDKNLWQNVRADGFARNALEAVKTASYLM